MKYLTFLDYTTLEATGKNIEANLQEKDREIAGLKEKYDTDIALLKEAMLDMQQLLKNPEKLAEISRLLNRKSFDNSKIRLADEVTKVVLPYPCHSYDMR